MMNNVISSELIKRIKKILGQFWLYEEFNGSALIGIESRSDILGLASEFATDVLGMISEDTYPKLEQILIDLCDAENQDAAIVEQKLYQMLAVLSDVEDLTIQDKIDILEVVVVSIVEKIKYKPYFEKAREELMFLDKVVKVAARLSYSENAELSDYMDVIVRDFEHAYEETTLRSIYEEIRGGTYLSEK